MENTKLHLPMIDGLELDEPGTSALDPGLRVIFGRNNAGKSRLLRALSAAHLVKVVNLNDLGVDYENRKLENEVTRQELSVEVTFDRSGVIHAMGSGEPPIIIIQDEHRTEEIKLGADFVHKIQSSVGQDRLQLLNDRFWVKIARAAQKIVVSRPMYFIQTNRFFDDDLLLSNRGSVDNLNQWASLLFSLRDKATPEGRRQWNLVVRKFREITDGLEFAFRGEEGNRRVYIEETDEVGYPLRDCGDGLRDILALIFLIVIHPTHDLFVEEPGIRLHPGAQRRVLHLLEEAAKTRPVWITTHDAVFVGARSAMQRFSVHRGADNISRVRRLADLNEVRAASVDLGWQPGDALLADTIVFCEGPSDRVALEAVVEHLSSTDASFSGVLIADLGGCGAVWGRDRSALLRTVSLLRSIAPHARQVVLLDHDNRDTGETSALAEALTRTAGLPVEWLSVPELEGFFLSSSVLQRVVTAQSEAIDRRVDDATITSRIQQELSAPDKRKASHRINDICIGVGLRGYDKIAGARLAMKHLVTDDRESFDKLAADVRQAISKARTI